MKKILTFFAFIAVTGLAADKNSLLSKMQSRYQIMGVIVDHSVGRQGREIAVIKDTEVDKTAIVKTGDRFPFEAFGKSFYINEITKDHVLIGDSEGQVTLRHPNGRNMDTDKKDDELLTVQPGFEDEDQEQIIDQDFLESYWESQATLLSEEEDHRSTEQDGPQTLPPPVEARPLSQVIPPATDVVNRNPVRTINVHDPDFDIQADRVDDTSGMEEEDGSIIIAGEEPRLND